jgi:hypothetical protein
MKTNPATYKPQVPCPSCGTLSAIDYCNKNQIYTWWCKNDPCGKQYKFIINDDWSTKTEPTGTIITRTAVTLKVKKTQDDLFIVVKGMLFDGKDNSKYYYQESTCPVNLIREGLEVRLGEDDDPHGVFEYVKTESLETFEE